jgi:hypothetical protein
MLKITLTSTTLFVKRKLISYSGSRKMIINNAESQTPRTRTNQEECWNSTNSGCTQRTGRDSSTVRSEPIASDRDDREKTDPFNQPGGIPLGGTLEQLISETNDEINEITIRSERLHKRLAELKKLFNQLQESKTENLTNNE